MEKTKTEQAREKGRDLLKSKGKDPDKLLPKVPPADAQPAAAASSTETKGVEGTPTKEQLETKRLADEAEKAEKAKAEKSANEAEEKRLLEAKDDALSPEERDKKKEILTLRMTEKEAKKEANLEKRFSELTGKIKDLKAETIQDKTKIAELESQLKQLKSTVDNEPKKNQEEAKRLEVERISKYEQEDKELPLAERREMSRAELENWMLEDMVSAQEWLAERQLRRRDERAKDQKRKTEVDPEIQKKVDKILSDQEESKKRVEAKYPNLDPTERINELKSQGKSVEEAVAITFKENPNAKVITELMQKNPDRYMFAGNGPELLAEDMEKVLGIKPGAQPVETEEDKEERLRQEGADAERERLENLDGGIRSTRGAGTKTEKMKDPMYKKQWDIFRKSFPKDTDAQITARLDKRLNERQLNGAA